jgi:ribonuclease P protein component
LVDGRYADEANLSAESNSPETGSWISGSDELARRTSDFEAPANEGPKAAYSGNPLEVIVVLRTGRFGRADRLLRPRDFQRVADSGRRIASRYFVVLVASSGGESGGNRRRLGLTVSRRVGNAVVRNRIKRAVRSWFRQRRGYLEEGIDLVVIPRRGAGFLTPREIAFAMDEMLVSKREER